MLNKSFYRALRFLLALPERSGEEAAALSHMLSQLPVSPRSARPLAFPPLANLSRNHPDYGLTPAEHYARKMERNK